MRYDVLFFIVVRNKGSYLLEIGLHYLIFKSLDQELTMQPQAGLVKYQNPEISIL